MIELPEKEDMRHLQKQLNAIYRFLKVHPLHQATTHELGMILVHDDVDAGIVKNMFQRETDEIEERFHE